MGCQQKRDLLRGIGLHYLLGAVFFFPLESAAAIAESRLAQFAIYLWQKNDKFPSAAELNSRVCMRPFLKCAPT